MLLLYLSLFFCGRTKKTVRKSNFKNFILSGSVEHRGNDLTRKPKKKLDPQTMKMLTLNKTLKVKLNRIDQEFYMHKTYNCNNKYNEFYNQFKQRVIECYNTSYIHKHFEPSIHRGSLETINEIQNRKPYVYYPTKAEKLLYQMFLLELINYDIYPTKNNGTNIEPNAYLKISKNIFKMIKIFKNIKENYKVNIKTMLKVIVREKEILCYLYSPFFVIMRILGNINYNIINNDSVIIDIMPIFVAIDIQLKRV